MAYNKRKLAHSIKRKNTMGLLVLFDFADIDSRKPLQVFCQLAANCTYQAIWLEKYSDSIHDLGYENAKLIEENKKLKAFSSSNIIKPIASSRCQTHCSVSKKHCTFRLIYYCSEKLVLVKR